MASGSDGKDPNHTVSFQSITNRVVLLFCGTLPLEHSRYCLLWIKNNMYDVHIVLDLINSFAIIRLLLCEVIVYTLDMDSWRRIQDFLYSGLLCGLGIFMVGTVNWLPLRVLCL
jgi:hypothetical protein